MTHLSQVVNPDVPGRTTEQHVKAKNYYALPHSKDVVYFLHFLADVPAALSDVSTAFQQKEITIADNNSKITVCKEVHDFGDDKVDTLVKTFGQVLSSSALDVSKVEPEWTKLKSLLYTSYPTVKKLS